VATSWTVCAPCARPVSETGEVQAAAGPPSSEHVVGVPVSAEKSTVALVGATVPVGPPSLVSVGGSVSTAHVKLAGVASVLPAGSVARPPKVWGPPARPGSGGGEGAHAPPSRRH